VLGAAIAIALLAPSWARADSVVLRWTAPGDDGNAGRASAYELRYSETAVPSDTTSWWASAINAGALPQPLTAGSGELFSVAGLDTSTTYYFVIRTRDEVPNWSGFSNVAVKTTGAGGALATPTGFAAQIVTGYVRLSWNMVTSGSPAGYHVYRRTVPGPIGTLILTAPVAQTSWTDSSVAVGTTYEYSIATYSGSSESAPALATITMPGGPPVTASTEMVGYPNPAKGRVTFRFHAGKGSAPGRARLVIYDLTGQRVCTLVDEVLPAGDRTIDWACMSDAGNAVAPGLYNAILDTPEGRQVTRLAIVP
jgi:hypothetical protein